MTLVSVRYTDERYKKTSEGGLNVYLYHQFPYQEEAKSFGIQGFL